MARKSAGAGGMPAEEKMAGISAEAALQPAQEPSFEQHAGGGGANSGAQAEGGSGLGFEAQPETGSDYAAKQPDFRVVQPEYNSIEGKTIFKDVGALWKNISKKTGREFYTMKIGKLKLLVFPNQKLIQNE